MDDLLTEIQANESGEVTAGHLMKYFEQRLRDIDQILQQLGGEQGAGEQATESLLDQLERARPEPIETENSDDDKTIFDLVQEEGVARGVRQFDGQSYQELPAPLEFDLNPTSRAILYTLGQINESDSVRTLTKAVIHDAITNAPESTVTLPENSDLEPLRASRTPPDSEVTDTLLNAVQSTVQYNLRKLEERGYIKRKDQGKRTSIELRMAGSIYVTSREFNAEWRAKAFEKLSKSIENALSATE